MKKNGSLWSLLFLLNLLFACSPKSEAPFVTEEAPVYNKTFVGKTTNSSGKFLSVYTEENAWHAVAIKKEENKVQEIEFHNKFYTKKEAAAFVASYVQANDLREESENEIKMREEKPTFVTDAKQDVVWPTKNNWSWDWELKYADWFKAEVNVNFFEKYNVLVDCADVAYALRWIFARIHYLPASGLLAGTKDLFTNESMKEAWRALPTDELWYKDKRFLAALNFILESTYTHTLRVETYPIEINSKALIRSTINLYVGGGTGHTLNVIKAEEDSMSVPIEVLWASVPRMLLVSTSAFFQSEQPTGKDEGSQGFVRFRWPVKEKGAWKLTEREKMPFYSLEQYDPEFMKNETNFTVAVLKKLFPGFDVKKLLEAAVENLEKSIKRRAGLVSDGYEYCVVKNNDCSPGSAGWEDWSTPSRDRGIREMIRDLQKFSHELADNYYDETGQQEKIWEVWTKAWIHELLDYKGEKITLKELVYIWTVGGYNVDPRVSPELRWGIEPASLVTNVSAKVAVLLEERSQLIRANTCVNSACEANSETWNKNSTHLVDGTLQYLDMNLSRYCRNMNSIRCTEFEKIKYENEIKVDGVETKSLGAWLDKAMWLNSDPRWESSVRWGSLESQWTHETFNPGSFFIRTDSNWRVRQLETKTVIEDLNSGKVIPWKENFEVVDFNIKNGKIIGKNKNQYLILDIKTQSEFVFTRETASDQPIRWYTPTLIYFPLDQQRFELFEVNDVNANSIGVFKLVGFNQNWTKKMSANFPRLDEYSHWSEWTGPRRHLVVEEGHLRFSVFDILDPHKKRPVITIPANMGKVFNGLEVRGEGPKAYYMNLYFRKCEELTCGVDTDYALGVNKETGLFKVVNAVNILNYPYASVSKKSVTSIVRIDEDFNIMETLRAYPGIEFIQKWRDEIWQASDQLQTRYVLRMNGGKLEEYANKDRDVWEVTKEKLLITSDKQLNSRIEDFNGNVLVSMKHIGGLRHRPSAYDLTAKVFRGTEVKWSPLYLGIYALKKFDHRPLLTGPIVFFSLHQSNTESPVFLGLNFDEISQVFEVGSYNKSLDVEVPSPFMLSESGVVIYKNRDHAIWLSSELPK